MISVIIPYVHDRGYLENAIASVITQTIEAEVIPIKGNRSQGSNINEGIEMANGEFIKILHDDDTLPPDALENLLAGIRGFDWVCGDMQTFGTPKYCPDPHIYKGRVPDFEGMLTKNHVYGGTTMYRAEVLRKVGGYDENLWTGEEYDLHLRLLKAGYRVNYIPKVVHVYRLHEFNKSYNMGYGEKKQRREYIRWIAERYQ